MGLIPDLTEAQNHKLEQLARTEENGIATRIVGYELRPPYVVLLLRQRGKIRGLLPTGRLAKPRRSTQ